MGTAWRTIRVWLMGACIAAMVGATAGLAAEELSDRQLNKLERQAGKALEGGEEAEARQLYESLLSATQPADQRRAEALHAVLMLEVAAAGELTPVAEALLDELLVSFPRHPQRRQITMLDHWRRQRRGFEAQVTELQSSLAEQVEACEAMTGELAGAAGEKEGQLRSENQRLRREVTSLKRQLETTESELVKKEQALEKLKDALVGGGG